MRKNPELVAEAQFYRNFGWSYDQIGDEFGVSKKTAWDWVNPVRSSTQQREYRKKNGDVIREKVRSYPSSSPTWRRAYRQSNQEAHRTYARTWRAKHPEKSKAINANSSARRRAAIRSAPTDPRVSALYVEAQRLSAATGVPHDVDHILPLSKGGTHTFDNLQIMTASENRSKGDRLDYGA